MAAHGQSGLAGADDDGGREPHDTRSLIQPPLSVDGDEDVRRVGDDVEYGRPPLRLSDQRLDVVLARVGANVEMNADSAKAIAYVVVDAEDALNVHVGLERGLDRMELYAAPLGDCSNARREAARKTGEDEFDGSRSVVLGRKDLRVVCLDRECLVAGLLSSEPEEIANGGAAVRAIQPFAARTPLELRGLRHLLQGLACVEQCSHINAVVHLGEGRHARCHGLSLLVSRLVTLNWSGPAVCKALSLRRARVERRWWIPGFVGGPAICRLPGLRAPRP